MFRANSPTRLVKLRDLLLSNRVRYTKSFCTISNDTAVKPGVTEYLLSSHFSVHGTHSLVFLSLRGWRGVLYMVQEECFR
jgi:hypothetical protein